jgi:hypothetical protein
MLIHTFLYLIVTMAIHLFIDLKCNFDLNNCDVLL